MLAKIHPEIIGEAQKGDVFAFEKILSHYERPIFAYVYRLLGHREDSEDVTQQTFIKLYRSLGRVDPFGDFNSWIYKIATNSAYDWLRKRGRTHELYILEEAMANGWEPPASVDLNRDLEKIENAEVLSSAMGRIKPAYRSVIMLHYFQDFSYQEISHILTVPVNTVRTHLYRAKHALKEILSG
jgi:RNA polymerase sigma-70 factor, ECF subfamily